jgi:hypothetical protein
VNIDIPAESLLVGDELALARTNQALESMSAEERVMVNSGTQGSQSVESGLRAQIDKCLR